jgi:hypothetical protein
MRVYFLTVYERERTLLSTTGQAGAHGGSVTTVPGANFASSLERQVRSPTGKIVSGARISSRGFVAPVRY